MRKIISLLLVTLPILPLSAQKTSEVQQFWNLVEVRLKNQLMSDQSRALTYAGMQTQLISEKFDKAKKIAYDKVVQDHLILYLLSTLGNGELLRLTLADMCGMYSLGNYMSKYIVNTYKNDTRYIKALREKEKNREIQHDISKSQPKQDELPPFEETVKRNGGVNSSNGDSLYKFFRTEAYPTYDFKMYLSRRLSKIKTKPVDQITVEFVITTEGSIDSIKLVPLTLDTTFNKDLMRIFSESPKWEPATLWRFGEDSKKQKLIEQHSIPIVLKTRDE
jgi:hypothetical protein